jgi:hypothetical protein
LGTEPREGHEAADERGEAREAITLVLWIALVVLLMIVAEVLYRPSPVRRMWANRPPGEMEAADLAGRALSTGSEFERPRDEGDLL